MCLVAFALDVGRHHLVLAANRDETYARPAARAHAWREDARVFGGRDLEGGGAWLAVGEGVRFAVVTNVRRLPLGRGARSRGELVTRFLLGGESARSFAEAAAAQAAEYGAFNLLCGDERHVCHASSHGAEARTLSAGVYGLSNASLDTPWPKVVTLRGVVERALDEPTTLTDALFAALASRERPSDASLPDTGVGLAAERWLSPAFIASEEFPHYGTRASTVVTIATDGHAWVEERSFGPMGAPMGTVRGTRQSGNAWQRVELAR